MMTNDRIRKPLTLFLVLMTAIFGSWVLNDIRCYFISCVEDFSTPPLEHVLGPIVIVIYSFLTLGIVFPSGLFLQKRFSIWISAAIPVGILSLLLSTWLYAPDVDDIADLFGFFSWLALPWFLGNVIGLRLWPKNKKASLNGDINV